MISVEKQSADPARHSGSHASIRVREWVARLQARACRGARLPDSAPANSIMATFSPHAVNTLNEIVATDSATTRMVHEAMGFSTASGLIGNLQVIPSAEHFTDEEIIHEGHLRGLHSGLVLGFPAPTFRQVLLPYVAIYRFDEHDMLVSERVKMDLSPLYAEAPSQIGEGP